MTPTSLRQPHASVPRRTHAPSLPPAGASLSCLCNTRSTPRGEGPDAVFALTNRRVSGADAGDAPWRLGRKPPEISERLRGVGEEVTLGGALGPECFGLTRQRVRFSSAVSTPTGAFHAWNTSSHPEACEAQEEPATGSRPPSGHCAGLSRAGTYPSRGTPSSRACLRRRFHRHTPTPNATLRSPSPASVSLGIPPSR